MNPDDDIRIETERLILRRMVEGDRQDVLEYTSRSELARWSSREHPYAEDDVRALIARQIEMDGPEEGHWFRLAVELKSGGKVIGDVCIKILSTTHRQGELGWFFNTEYHGQGYATEAAQALMRYGFETLDLHRLSARCDVENTRSRLLMERLGMRPEGVAREVAFYKEMWHSQYGYAVLKDEWNGRKGLRRWRF